MQHKKEQLIQSYNDFDLSKQYQELREGFQSQQRQWQLFIEQYA